MINPDANKKYTNAELAQVYFEVIAQGSSNQKYISYRKDQKGLETVEENIQIYFEKNKNLSGLDIPHISEKSVVGTEKRKILERILLEGKDTVKKDLETKRIESDFLTRI